MIRLRVLAILTIRARLEYRLEAILLANQLGYIFYSILLFRSTHKGGGDVRRLNGPRYNSSKVIHVHKLTQRSPRTHYPQGPSGRLANKGGYNVPGLDREVVVRAVQIRRDQIYNFCFTILYRAQGCICAIVGVHSVHGPQYELPATV